MSDFPKDANEYLVSDATKAVGRIIETLEKLTEEFKEANIEVIFEKAPEALPAFHKSLVESDAGLKSFLIISGLCQILSKEPENEFS